MTQLGEAFVPIRATLEKLDGDLAEAKGKIDGALSGIGAGIQQLGGLALGGIVTGIAAVGVALGGLGAFAFDAGMMVDDAMDTISIATGATGDELAGLQDSFETVFSTVPTDAETAADIISILNSRLGLTGDELDDLAVPLAQVTEMMGGDAATNAQTLSDIISKFNLPAEDAASVLDGLFVASQESGVGFDTLSQKVAAFSTPLQQMGLSVNESIALLASLEGAGLNTESVMVGLRTAAAGFAAEGISVADGLAQTIEAIQNATDPTEALNLAVETFGVRAGPEMVAAIQDGKLAFEDLLPAIQNADGAIGESMNQTADFGEMWTLVKNKAALALAPIGAMLIDLANQVMPLVEDAFAWFEETLLPVIEEVAATVSEFIGTFIGNLQEGQGPVEAFKNALAEFVPPELMTRIEEIITAVGDFIAQAQEVLTPILEAITQFVSWKDVLIGLGVAIATVVVPAIGSILAAIAPVILAFVAVTAAVALVRNAWENDWGGIRTKLTEVWEGSIRPALETLRDWLQVQVPIALEALRTFWVDVAWPAIVGAAQWFQENVVPILQNIWDWLSVNVPAALETLRAFWVETAWPAIQTAIETVWPIIENIFTTLRDWITNTLIPTVEELYTKWTTEWWPQIQTALENAWTVIEAIFTEVGRWINDNIVPWVVFLKEQWQQNFETIKGVLEAVWQVIEPIWTSFVDWLEVKIPEALNALQPIFEGVMSGINAAVQPVKDLWDAFADAVQRFWDWITSHEFNFSLNIPDIPDWAVPGSPLPIHTAWQDFANFIRTTDMELAFNVPDLGAEFAGGAAGPVDSSTTEFHLHLAGEAGQSRGVMRDFALLRGLVGEK